MPYSIPGFTKILIYIYILWQQQRFFILVGTLFVCEFAMVPIATVFAEFATVSLRKKRYTLLPTHFDKNKQSTLLISLANLVNFSGVSMTTPHSFYGRPGFSWCQWCHPWGLYHGGLRCNVILGPHLFETISRNWKQISNEIEQHIRRLQCKHLRLSEWFYQWNVRWLYWHKTLMLLDTCRSPPWLL